MVSPGLVLEIARLPVTPSPAIDPLGANGRNEMKCCEAGRIVSKAVIIAVAFNTDGRREGFGMAIGPSDAEPLWTDFLRSLTRRGLRGVKLEIFGSH